MKNALKAKIGYHTCPADDATCPYYIRGQKSTEVKNCSLKTAKVDCDEWFDFDESDEEKLHLGLLDNLQKLPNLTI